VGWIVDAVAASPTEHARTLRESLLVEHRLALLVRPPMLVIRWRPYIS
jgi:hypothetical protein